jgi:hypothetical protein
MAVALALIIVLIPAAAWAGKKVVSGRQSLQIKVTVSPARAGARGVAVHFHSDYMSTQPGGQQPPYNEKSLTVTEPKGLVLHPSAVPSCRESKVVAVNGDAAKVCPASAKVGHGSVIVNARPAIKSLITGAITAYNGVDDGGVGGYAKGSPELILYVKTSIGVNTVDYLHIVKSPAGLQLVGHAAKPTKPGVVAGDITLQRLDLTLSAGKAYSTAPPTCSGSWLYTLTLRNWFGQPSITARDRVPCTK